MGLGCLLAVHAPGAPVQWRSEDGGNNHWYNVVLIGEEGITWTEADLAAQGLGDGWHLATITSSAENAFVYGLVSELPEIWENWSGMGCGPWLGGYRTGSSVQSYAWVTGEPFDYTNWGPYEPTGTGDRIALFGYQNPSGGPHWNDVYATSTRPRGFIAENPQTSVSDEAYTWGQVKHLFQ